MAATTLAWRLGREDQAVSPGTQALIPLSLCPLFPQDPCLSALLLDELPACRPEAERRCDVCTTHLTQLTREALRLLQAPASREDPDAPHGGPGLMPPSPGAATSPRDGPAPVGPVGRQLGRVGPDRRKGLGWPSGPSVQVSVAPAGLGGALSTVTIQAQQCLEGMWSVSRVNSFLPPTCLVSARGAVGSGPPGTPGRTLTAGQGWALSGAECPAQWVPCSTAPPRAGGLCLLEEAPDIPKALVKSAYEVTGGQGPLVYRGASLPPGTGLWLETVWPL